MSNNGYGAIGLIGGAAGDLDAIDGAALTDKDTATVYVQDDKVYHYVLDADSAATESSPDIIAPDANGGDKRWILHRPYNSLDPTLGSDHTYSGTIVSEAVGESVVFGNLVYKDLSEAEWKLADASALGTMPGAAIALETKGNGEVCKLLLEGYIRDDSWGWTVDDTKKFVWNSSTAGGISETATAVSTELVQKVGLILSATKIYFRPDWTLITVP